jgi:hypothetical protein
MCDDAEEFLAYTLAKNDGSKCFDFGGEEYFEDREKYRLMACSLSKHY